MRYLPARTARPHLLEGDTSPRPSRIHASRSGRGIWPKIRVVGKGPDHSRAAARDAGLTVTDRTLKAWLDGGCRPSRANLDHIDAAYRAVRRWDRIVDAWATGDHQGLDDAWTFDVLPDLGSQWGQYEYVTNIGFAA
ncbi:hypothetical protein ACWCQE_39355 [Streptomyces sp. NPDC002409]